MFYYPTVLKRHSGCFSTIWLVATRGIRVPRREFLKVNVESTCDGIMEYVLALVPPPRADLPRPRFSLYLSSQLQYGVVLVYHRQCALLLEELYSTLGRMSKQSALQKIDMEDPSRKPLDLPDALSLQEETEGAADPMFGLMYMQAMPSPNTLIQMGAELHSPETSPERPESSPDVVAAAAPLSLVERGITASPESITLREREPVAIPMAEFEGEELVDQLPETIDLLMAQDDNFPEGDVYLPREEATPMEQEREMVREGEPEMERPRELTASTIESHTATASNEEALLLPQDDSVERPAGPPTDQFTPPHTVPPPLPSQPPAPRQRPREEAQDGDSPELRIRRRRKRQLIFFDPQTQIPQDVLHRRIADQSVDTRPAPLCLPPSRRMPSAAELFNNPVNFLPEDIRCLWRGEATVRSVLGSELGAGDRGRESTDSDKDGPGETAQQEDGLEHTAEELRGDLPELEMNNLTEYPSLPLEGPDQRDVSGEMSPLLTLDREGSPVSVKTVRTLQNIPEVVDGVPEAAQSPGPLLQFAEAGFESFHSLLPPEVNRRTVSNIFLRLLETLSWRKIRAEQSEPYGEILLAPGPLYGRDAPDS